MKLRNKNRIMHPTYKFSYAYERNGTAYTSVHKVRETTNLVWCEENFEDIADILDDRAREHKAISTGKAKYWSELYIIFRQYKNTTMVEMAARAIMVNNFLVNDIKAARELINKFMADPSRSPNTKNRYLRAISSVYEFGIREGVCNVNPTKIYNTLKENKREVPTDAEIEALVNDLKSYPPKIQMLIRLILLSGLRIQEAMNIREDDYTPEFLTIHGKGGRDRYFPLYPFPEIYDLLGEINTKFGKHGWIFGRGYSHSNYCEMQYTASRRETFVNFHLLRKYRENELAFKLKIDKNIVAKMFGHTISIQDKHYMKVGYEKEEMKNYFGEPKDLKK